MQISSFWGLKLHPKYSYSLHSVLQLMFGADFWLRLHRRSRLGRLRLRERHHLRTRRQLLHLRRRGGGSERPEPRISAGGADGAAGGRGRRNRAGGGTTTTMSMGNFNTISILARGCFQRQSRTRGREEGIVLMEMTNNGNSTEDNVVAVYQGGQ